jgi:hypothetical protein
LQAIRNCAFQEGIGGLLKSDAVLAHAVGQPMVLIETDTGGEWKVRADPHEHPSPIPVIDVKVVLNDPALRELEVPSVCDLVADGNHDPRRFSRLEDGHDGVRLGPFEIRVNKFSNHAVTQPRKEKRSQPCLAQAPKRIGLRPVWSLSMT